MRWRVINEADRLLGLTVIGSWRPIPVVSMLFGARLALDSFFTSAGCIFCGGGRFPLCLLFCSACVPAALSRAFRCLVQNGGRLRSCSCQVPDVVARIQLGQCVSAKLAMLFASRAWLGDVCEKTGQNCFRSDPRALGWRRWHVHLPALSFD